MPINGRVRDIDACLALLVATLNTVPALETLASCCGHGHLPPRVDLADGRVLVVMTQEQADAYYPTFGVNIHGERTPATTERR
jgi:hypothetical protein